MTITYTFNERTLQSRFVYSDDEDGKKMAFEISRKTAKKEVKLHGLKVVSKTFMNGVLTVNYGL